MRLKLFASPLDDLFQDDFNPTRVRLKPGVATSCVFSTGQLQPHKGASETVPTTAGTGLALDFNPTRVRLKRVMHYRFADDDATSTPQGCV